MYTENNTMQHTATHCNTLQHTAALTLLYCENESTSPLTRSLWRPHILKRTHYGENTVWREHIMDNTHYIVERMHSGENTLWREHIMERTHYGEKIWWREQIVATTHCGEDKSWRERILKKWWGHSLQSNRFSTNYSSSCMSFHISHETLWTTSASGYYDGKLLLY